MNIQDLIQSGQHKLDEQARIKREQADEAEQKARAQRLVLLEQFKGDVIAATPNALVPYLVFFDETGDVEPSHNEDVIIRVPDCAEIRFEMIRTYQPDRTGERKSVYFWKRERDIYRIQDPTGLYMDYEYDENRINYETFITSDIEIALARAFQAAQIEKELGAKADEMNTKIKDKLAAYSAKQEAESDDDRAAADELKRKRESLIAAIANDPVWFQVAQLALSIQADHEKWQNALYEAQNGMADMEHNYSARLQRADEQIRQADRRAEDAQSREQEARDEADRAERKLKQARDEADRAERKLKQAQKQSQW